MRKIFSALIAIMIFSSLVSAEIPLNEKISIDGIFRYRMEIDGRDFDSESGLNEYSYLRTMIGIKVQINEDLILRTKFKDSRFLGTSGSNKESSSKIDMQEAYVQAKNLLNLPLCWQIGRFEMLYGRRRIMGNGNWNNYGPRTYDGSRLTFKMDMLKIDLFYIKIVERGFINQPPYTDDPYSSRDRSLFGISGSILDGMIQPLVVIDTDPEPGGISGWIPEESNVLNTFAVFAKYSIMGINLEGDFAMQTGTRNDRDLNSFLLALDAAYTLDHSMKPSVGVGIDITSGNHYSKDGYKDEDRVFYADFMSRHRFKGYMDYFKNDNDIRQGLIDTIIRFGIQPLNKMKISLDFHDFATYEEAANTVDGTVYTYYGQEIDFRLETELLRGLYLDSAICAFLPGDDWQNDLGKKGDTAMFYYLALVTKF